MMSAKRKEDGYFRVSVLAFGPRYLLISLSGNDEQVMTTNLIEENHDGERCDVRAFCSFLELIWMVKRLI